MEQVLVEKPHTGSAKSSVGGISRSAAKYQHKVKILCFDLTAFPQTLQFIFCCIAVFFCYIIYGYMQVHTSIHTLYIQ
jgi:hypothetical protein